MIEALVELGDRIRTKMFGELKYDSLTFTRIESLIEIDIDGRFIELYPLPEPRDTIVEDVVRMHDAGRTSGELPRLIVDNAQYVLGFPDNERSKKCFSKYHDKLKQYIYIEPLNPIFSFYENQQHCLAREKYELLFNAKKVKNGNIAFFVHGQTKLLHEGELVYAGIEKFYQQYEIERCLASNVKCGICGSDQWRVANISTHDSISKVPGGQPSGCYLVSYNNNAFTSYGLDGNDNAGICSHCVKNYVEGLNWLMTHQKKGIDKKGRPKDIFTNRITIGRGKGGDTAIVYWTRNDIECDEITLLDDPDVESVTNLLSSVHSGKKKALYMDTDQFYALTLSGASARIAVRDWLEISLATMRENVAEWFKDIEIQAYGENKYPGIPEMAKACDNDNSKDNQLTSRVGAVLWNAALKNRTIPIWVLSAVLSRIRAEHKKDKKGKPIDSVTAHRAALIKLILNRLNKNGGIKYMPSFDQNNKEAAYWCGAAFAVLERIQWHAQGKNKCFYS